MTKEEKYMLLFIPTRTRIFWNSELAYYISRDRRKGLGSRSALSAGARNLSISLPACPNHNLNPMPNSGRVTTLCDLMNEANNLVNQRSWFIGLVFHKHKLPSQDTRKGKHYQNFASSILLKVFRWGKSERISIPLHVRIALICPNESGSEISKQ